jgi:ribosomal protein L13
MVLVVFIRANQMKVFGKKDTEEVYFKRWNEPLNPEKSTYLCR